MTAATMRTNLGDWENPPVIQDQVIAYMEQIGGAMILRDIYRPLGLPRYTVNRVLGRLHSKGILSRYKIPVPVRSSYDPCREEASPNPATRLCFLYSFAETIDAQLK